MPLTVEEVSSHSCTEQPRLQQKQRLRASRRGLQVSCSIFRIKKLRRWRATRFLFIFYFFAPIKKNRRAPATQVRPRGGAAAAAAVFCCTFAACSKQVVQERLCACKQGWRQIIKIKKRGYTVSVHIAHGCHASHQVNNHVSYHLIHRFSFHAKTFLQRLHYVLLMQLLHDIRRQRGSRLKC